MNVIDTHTDSDNEAAAALPAPVPHTRVHFGSILIGMLLVAGMAYVVPYTDLVGKQLELGTLHFAPGAFGGFLFAYLLINGLKRVGLLKWLNAADMLIIYVMLFVGVFVVARGLLERLIPSLVYLNYFSTAQNDYADMFSVHLRQALLAFDPGITRMQPSAKEFFEGGHNLQIPWVYWIPSLITWFTLFALIIWTFLCLAAVLRKQWEEGERLSFPQTVLPISLMEDEQTGSIFKNPLTWAGVAIPTVIYLINGLHQSFPTVPEIPLIFGGLTDHILTPPFNNIYNVSIYMSFAALGFAYLLPSDLLFSLWFFFALTRVGDIVCSAMGIVPVGMPSYPTRAYIGFQAAGSYFMLAALFAYGGRHYFRAAFLDAFQSMRTGSAKLDDEDELLPRRTAVLGLLAGFVGIILWSIWAGLSPLLAICIWAIYIFITATVLTRSVSEAGMLMTETSFRPSDVVGMFWSKISWGPTNWAIISMLNAVFFRDMRGLFLALFMDDQKMAGDVKMRRRTLLPAIFLAILVSMVIGSYVHLSLSYEHGAVNLYNYGYSNTGWAFGDAHSTLTGTETPFPEAKIWFAVGIAVTAVLAFLRARFIGFPLNPLGYALAPTWTMIVIWFPIFLMWVIKSLMLRYGGSNLYRRARPFFLGLILGEFGSGAFWAIFAAITKLNAPQFPWGG